MGDGTIAVGTFGTGEAVLLLHGWTLDRRVWRPQIDALSTSLRLICPDRRGFGRSTAPPNLAREVDDILRLADVLDVERMAIVGMSQAARVALALGLRHPDRVASITVQGAPDFEARSSPEEAATIEAMRALATSGELASMRDLWRSHELARVHAPAEQALLDAIIGSYRARDLVHPGARLDIDPVALADFPLPVLVITGEWETRSRQYAADRLSNELLPNGERLIVSGAGHLCNLCNAADFNAGLLDFLARVRAGHREDSHLVR